MLSVPRTYAKRVLMKSLALEEYEPAQRKEVITLQGGAAA